MKSVSKTNLVSKTAEIILINDSSEDNTGDIKKRISSSKEYSSVIHIKSNKTLWSNKGES